ncbi:MAG: nitrate transporter substrate-binding protein [Rhizobacter sp.]|nr:nitrate transporter substrate-binding protein [Rhizobacter sp.]
MASASIRHGRRRVLHSAAALSAAAWLPALAQGTAKKQVTLSAAEYPIAGLASMVVGEQQGLFAAEGITLKKEAVKLPADAIANLMGGRLQIAFINVGGLSQAALQGLPLKVVGTMYFSEGRDTGLYVKADSPIRGMADLTDKSLALVQLKNNVHAAVLQQIDAAGVDANKVKISLIPVTNTVSALRAGTVDVAQVVEPFATAAGDAIRSILDNPFSLMEKRSVIAHYVTTQQFARDNPDVVAAFTRALNKSHELAARDPDAVRKAIASYTEIPPDVLARIRLPVFATELALDSVNRQIEVMVKYKILPSRPDLTRFFA